MADLGPTLRTARLELAPVREPDVPALHALFSLEPVHRYLLDGEAPDEPWVASVVFDSAADFARRGLGLWLARRPGESALVGFVGFRDFFEPPVEELIYGLHPEAWGQHLASEMATAAIEHAFTVCGRERVRASTDLPNQASTALLHRLGFRETHRDPPPPGCPWEQLHFALEREGWASGD